MEIYNDLRYDTIMGNLHGSLKRIEIHPGELQRIHNKWLLPAPGFTQRASAYQTDNSAGNAMEILQVGLYKDPVMRSSWMGDHRRGDESSSDQALMNKLAYWRSANQPAMIQAFLASPYHAQKDDAHKKKCQRADYLPKTASHACVSLRSTAREVHLHWQQRKQNVWELWNEHPAMIFFRIARTAVAHGAKSDTLSYQACLLPNHDLALAALGLSGCTPVGYRSSRISFLFRGSMWCFLPTSTQLIPVWRPFRISIQFDPSIFTPCLLPRRQTELRVSCVISHHHKPVFFIGSCLLFITDIDADMWE